MSSNETDEIHFVSDLEERENATTVLEIATTLSHCDEAEKPCSIF